VAHVLNLGDLYVDRLAPGGRFLVLVKGGKIVRNGAVVVGRMLEGFAKETEVSCRGQRAAVLSELGKDRAIILGIDDYTDMLIILRRRPHHTRAADVDILDDLIEGRAARYRRLEGIKIADTQMEGDD